MKGNETLLTVLNQLLADELTAISQYTVHSEMCDSWGYDKLHKAIEHQALQILKMEEGHADWAEMQRAAQIEQMGLQNYLANQTTGAAS
jgi:bacterioferritin